MTNIPERPRSRKRYHLSDAAIADIFKRIRAGDIQHDPGRVSEIKTGLRGNHITGLPPR